MRTVSLVLLVLLLIALISPLAFQNSSFATSEPPTISLVNPDDGSSDFNFTNTMKNFGDTFIINVTVINVTALAEWQVRIGWDASLLSYVSIVLPSDNVFAGDIAAGGNISTVGPDTSILGSVLYGVTATPPVGGWSFNGTGTLAVLTLEIIQGVGILNPSVACRLEFLNITTDSHLINSTKNQIQFTALNARYNLIWYMERDVDFFMSPSTVEPGANGDIFSVDIMVEDVPQGWEITQFQFSIMWNTTLMEPAGTFFDNGTFLEEFQYAPNGVAYATRLNVHDRAPPLTQIPDDYNFSRITETLLPDAANNNNYHPPYPNGAGKLGTFWFKAIYEPFPPVDVQSRISFIAEDLQVLNHWNNMSIGWNTAIDATYVVPRERDIMVSNVTVPKTVVGQGYTIACNITVGNHELIAESFNLSVYVNATNVSGLTSMIINGGELLVVSFVWNTTGFAYGNYTLWAYAPPLPGETNTTNNHYTCNVPVHVGVPGDESSSVPGVYDGIVNMKDLAYLVSLFNTKPSSPNWNPNADINNDGVVDMKDIATAVYYFNQHE